MPGYPRKDELMEFYSKKGYWVFLPRYRGSWESDGEFLKISPHQDILDIIDELPKGFVDLWNNKRYKVKFDTLDILGTSFGGAAALLASPDPRITRVVTLSPMVDWQAKRQREPLDKMFKFMAEAFGNGYRTTKTSYAKLSTGKFYHPTYEARKIAGNKIMIIHAEDDDVVSADSVRKYAKLTASHLILLKRGGHLSSKLFMQPHTYTIINKFLKHGTKH